MGLNLVLSCSFLRFGVLYSMIWFQSASLDTSATKHRLRFFGYSKTPLTGAEAPKWSLHMSAESSLSDRWKLPCLSMPRLPDFHDAFEVK